MKIEDISTVCRLHDMGFAPQAIRELGRISRALHSLAERECNGEGWGERRFVNGRWFPQWTDADQKRADNRTAALLQDAQGLCDAVSRHGLAAYHQGDPRGCALYIVRLDALGDRSIDEHYTTYGVPV